MRRTPLVPGLTTHHAKRREWEVVGICSSSGESQALANGLGVEIGTHRQLYVAVHIYVLDLDSSP
jgi:hypothetical protein